MRKKVLATVVAFSTTTQAMAMEKRAWEGKFDGRLIPLPREIAAGCGLAWRCREQSETETKEFMENENLEYLGIYRVLVS